ncbi:19916_t:CDS:2 [Racocetra fulgida]|uniref:19916_t:CDS:1 n=1 Tax=Racocetra fulgida TaxID=60492 RepID=A0A9N9AR49_9GLOM|nr:19916_t:CDS:2 [Racocetra fulgida]
MLGLKPQHLSGLQLIRDIFKADLQGDKLSLPPRAQKAILKGGTNVGLAPPIDFLIELDVISDCSVCNLRYYPQGGGEVILSVDPLVEQALKPLSMINRAQVFSNETLPELKNIKPDIKINIEKIASGKGPVTQHTRTAIHFAEIMSGAKFKIDGNRLDDKCPDDEYTVGLHTIECEGIGKKIAR